MFKDRQDALVYGSGIVGFTLAAVGVMCIVWGSLAGELPFGAKLVVTGLTVAMYATSVGFLLNQR